MLEILETLFLDKGNPLGAAFTAIPAPVRQRIGEAFTNETQQNSVLNRTLDRISESLSPEVQLTRQQQLIAESARGIGIGGITDSYAASIVRSIADRFSNTQVAPRVGQSYLGGEINDVLSRLGVQPVDRVSQSFGGQAFENRYGFSLDDARYTGTDRGRGVNSTLPFTRVPGLAPVEQLSQEAEQRATQRVLRTVGRRAGIGGGLTPRRSFLERIPESSLAGGIIRGGRNIASGAGRARDFISDIPARTVDVVENLAMPLGTAFQSAASYIQRIQDAAEGGTTEGIVDFVSQGLLSTGTGQFRAPQGRAFENIFEEPEQIRRSLFGDRIQDTTPQIDATSNLSSIREIAPLFDRIELFESGNQDQLFFDTFAEDMERATGVLGQFQVQVDKTTPVVEDFGRTLRDPEVVDAVNKIDFAFQQAFRTAREGVAALSSAEQGGGSILANLFGRGRIDEAEDNLAVIQQRYADEREAVISNTKKTEEEKLALIRQLRAKETSELEAIGIKDARNRLEVEDQFYTDLLTLAQTGNKEFVALYKASAISQTIIATYSSAQKAFDALAGIPIVGPGLATGAAAIAVAAGLARVAIIKAQRFQEGGIVGGGSRFGDNTIVRANAGEMFINTQQQRELFNFIRGGSRGRRSVNNVNIYGAPAGTRTETSQNAQGGEDTDVFIGNAVRGIIAQDLATGTGVSPMLESVYGMRRIG